MRRNVPKRSHFYRKRKVRGESDYHPEAMKVRGGGVDSGTIFRTCSALAVTSISAAGLFGGGCHSVSTTVPSDDDIVERERGWNWLRRSTLAWPRQPSCLSLSLSLSSSFSLALLSNPHTLKPSLYSFLCTPLYVSTDRAHTASVWRGVVASHGRVQRPRGRFAETGVGRRWRRKREHR